jgi:cytoskeletal protein CcmA (bactofilin family)
MAMFGSKKKDGDGTSRIGGSPGEDVPARAPMAQPSQPQAGRMPASPAMPELPRRLAEVPGAPARRPDSRFGAEAAKPASAEPKASVTEDKKLIVGRDIHLSGEIKSCDRLVVEGQVEAQLNGCRSVEIAGAGLFKGSAEIDVADISGRFEGDLTVRSRLIVRASGRIVGSIRYGQIEVERGGVVSGKIELLQGAEAGARPEGSEGASASGSSEGGGWLLPDDKPAGEATRS